MEHGLFSFLVVDNFIGGDFTQPIENNTADTPTMKNPELLTETMRTSKEGNVSNTGTYGM